MSYVARLTIIVPEAHLENANHLACVLGLSMADVNTFIPCYEDGEGNKYAITSGLIKDNVIGDAVSALQRPDFDTGSEIDMTKASQAQALIRFDYEDVNNAITATVDYSLTDMALEAGLTVIPIDIE